jgi:4-carboxymuconolactone decarboxylase
MARIALLKPEEMNAEQLAVHAAAVAGKRGRAPLPLLAWLHSPELADRAQRLGEYVRYDTMLDPRISEVAILVVARYWTAHYEWAAHKREALCAGVSEATVAAIARGGHPEMALPDEQLVYEFAHALVTRHAVGDELFARATVAFGERGVVELVGVLGYYTLIAMTLNAFEIESGERELVELS